MSTSFITQNQPIVLASQSESRILLLQALGLDIIIHKSTVDETKIKNKNLSLSPKDLCIILAEEKAKNVSMLYPNNIIIGGDQVCHLNGKYFSKAKSQDEAMIQLLELQNKEHELISAASICCNNKMMWRGAEKAVLKMRKLNKNQIKTYLQQDTPYKVCGSYQYELSGKYLFTKVNGSYECILGLPLHKLLSQLFRLKIISWDEYHG